MKKSKDEKQVEVIGKKAGWITKDGEFDITKFPIDGSLKKILGNDEDVRNAVSTLNSMQYRGRIEAGIFLMGFLLYCPKEDVKKKEVVVEGLEHFNTKGCADLLFSELKRVKSSNKTRRYINAILKTLSTLDFELIEEGFEELIEDKSFSYRMKNKFKEIIGEKTISKFDKYDFY